MSKDSNKTTCSILTPYNDPYTNDILDNSENDNGILKDNKTDETKIKEGFFNYQPQPLYNYKTSGHIFPRGLAHWRGKIQPYWRHRWSRGVYPFKPYYHYPINQYGYVYTHYWPYYFPSPYSYLTPVYENGTVKYVESFGIENDNSNSSENMNFLIIVVVLAGLAYFIKQ
jgi:hypothetical protein